MKSALAVLATFLVLAACGDGAAPGDGDGPSPVTTVISLTADAAPSVKTGIGPVNLLDPCSAPWPGWTGEATGIRCLGLDEIPDDSVYSPHGVLLIPAPTDGKRMTVGMRRFDQPLREGYQYRLTVEATGGAAVILFPFGPTGALIPVPGVSGLAIVRSGESLAFIAPGNVAGFFVQVQGGWDAEQDNTVAPYVPTPNESGGLMDVRRPWNDWSGNYVAEVSYNGLTGHTQVDPPDPGQSLRYGVQRYDVGLLAGQEYRLSIRSSRGIAWLLLFMFDANGQLIPYQPEQPWVQLIGQEGETAGMQFTAPAGVASFGVQIQGAYNATDLAVVYPQLGLVGAAQE